MQNVESAGIFGTGWEEAIHQLSCPEIRREISGGSMSKVEKE